MFQILKSPDFLPILSEQPKGVELKLDQEKSITGKYFLKNILSAFKTLLAITKVPKELFESMTERKDRIVAHLFKSDTLELLSQNF